MNLTKYNRKEHVMSKKKKRKRQTQPTQKPGRNERMQTNAQIVTAIAALITAIAAIATTIITALKP